MFSCYLDELTTIQLKKERDRILFFEQENKNETRNKREMGNVLVTKEKGFSGATESEIHQTEKGEK